MREINVNVNGMFNAAFGDDQVACTPSLLKSPPLTHIISRHAHFCAA
tara:strand:+ start:145 stop:285 length:141 start_codon:yes stop_codon:yes gene_type:complete